MPNIRVLVCDDSVVVRRIVAEMIDRDPELEVVGTARDGADALRQVQALNPDIMTLDIEMPVMDGLETLRNLRTVAPRLPVVMFSTLTTQGSSAALDALSLGAKDYVGKPSNVGRTKDVASQLEEELIPKLKALVPGRLQPAGLAQPAARPQARAEGGFGDRSGRIDALLIASSTGGPVALEDLFRAIKQPLPVPTLIVQHIPPVFSEMLAERLDKVGPTHFHHAEPGMPVQAGHAYLAPGGLHMTIERQGANLVIGTNEGPKVNHCRPAADVLFESAEPIFGGNALCVVLTGMGNDGAEGCRRLTAKGASVIAQDEPTSVVWGMPRAVTEAGLANEVLPLPDIAGRIESWLGRHARPTVGSIR
ncbi:MAG: chemotaxis response regulator protein-glutamate methylesterase [Actinomycetota bacterium]